MYTPKPIDTSQVTPYGPARNDELKQHPGLVPYDELSESEKEYDRVTAMEALKAIYALGYKIVPA